MLSPRGILPALLLLLEYLVTGQGQTFGRCTSPEAFKDKVECKRAGCEYNLVTNSCQAGYTECKADIGISGCRRSNSFYSEGGVVFHYKDDELGNCTIKNMVKAVNLGKWGTFTDSRNITFEHDSSALYTDPGLSRRGILEGLECGYDITGSNPVDNPIWVTQILARPVSRYTSGGCVTYNVKIVKDGVYELNIRTVESFISGLRKSRQFNIRVNGVDVVPELNILNYVKVCQALELIIEFEVANGKLKILGLPSQDILYNGNIGIGFCYGGEAVPFDIRHHREYLVSSFYVAEMNANEKGAVSSCTGGGGVTPDGNEDTGITPATATTTDTATCHGFTGCRTNNSWYVQGGHLIRHNESDQGNCTTKDIRLAVNLGTYGKVNETKTGISYSADGPTAYTDTYYSREGNSFGGVKCLDGVTGILPEDIYLWRSSVQGNLLQRKMGRCLTYHSKITQDGFYIVKIKTVETFLEEHYKEERANRRFNIRLNDQTILSEFNILDHVGPCEALEINVEFEVLRGVLTVPGYPGQNIYYTGTVDIGFCYGDEEASDTYIPDYLASALLIAELGGTAGKCTSVNAPQITEPFQNFSNELEGVPIGVPEWVSNTEYNPAYIGITGCRRGNTFYAEGGKLYHNILPNDKGVCEPKGVPIALNLGKGQVITDHRNIRYKQGTAQHYSDMDGITSTFISECNEIISDNKHDSTWPIYAYQLVSLANQWRRGRCAVFRARIPGDGVYEVNIKTVGGAYSNNKVTRAFNIRLNGMVVVPGASIMNHGIPCQALDLVIEFQVNNGVLTTTGFPGQSMTDSMVDVGICYGDHSQNSTYDPNFIISGIYIAHMEGAEKTDITELCPSVSELRKLLSSRSSLLAVSDEILEGKHTGATTTTGFVRESILPEQDCDLPQLNKDPSLCDKAGCRYNNASRSCQPIFKRCSKPLNGLQCRRPKTFSNHGGQICYNDDERELGGCTFANTLIAINLGCHTDGCDHVDSRGIRYEPDSYKLFDDIHETRVDVGGQANKCKDTSNIPSLDAPLYDSYIYGNIEKAGRGRCANYYVTLPPPASIYPVDDEEGPSYIFGRQRFELNIKTIATIASILEPSGRSFSIRLNGMVIMEEFKLDNYVDHCQGLEFITEFIVYGWFLTPSGLTGGRIQKNRTVSIGFCYGNGEKGEDYNPSYIAVAFYIAELLGGNCEGSMSMRRSKEECEKLNMEPVWCKDYQCEYDDDNNECRPKPSYTCCELGLTGCRRAHAHYIVGGKVCRVNDTTDQGNCTIAHTNMAINFGNDTITDSRGVTHQRQMNTQQEPYFTDHPQVPTRILTTTWAADEHQCKTPDTIQGHSAAALGPKSLYHQQMWGGYRNCISGKGRTYHATVAEDGRYELSIKLVETLLATELIRIRRFAITINTLLVTPDFSVSDYASLCEGLELIIEIEVKQGMVRVAGFDPIYMHQDGQIDIEFGCGEETWTSGIDDSFLVSAFYISRLVGAGNDVQPSDFCHSTTVSENTVNEKEYIRCSNGGGQIGCQHHRCQYQVGRCGCVPPYQYCPATPSLTGCSRAKSFYIKAWRICYNDAAVDTGSCTVETTVIAVNVGCLCDDCEVTDSRGITYIPDSYKLFSDINHTRIVYPGECNSEFSRGEKGFYCTAAYSYSATQQDYYNYNITFNCMSYHASIPGDGVYELSIKMPGSTGSNRYPFFNVLLNGAFIIKEDQISINQLDSPVDFITEFKVDNGILTLAGLPGEIMPDDRNVILSFCNYNYSGYYYTGSYYVNAFYIVKLSGHGGEDQSTCKTIPSTSNNESQQCKKGGNLSQDHTGFFQPRANVLSSLGCASITGCRRVNATYFNAGAACHSKPQKDEGDCKIKSIAIAVNLGGYAWTGSRGIKYMDFRMTNYTDEGKSLRVDLPSTSKCKDNVAVYPPSDRAIFLSQIAGDPDQAEPGRCVNFHGKVSENGRYELSIKTAETSPEKGATRYFNIQLNDLIVAPEFNILKYALPCQGMELIIEFQVEGGVLTVAGFPGKPLGADGKIDVGFCYGDGKSSDSYRPSYFVSGFYIAKI